MCPAPGNDGDGRDTNDEAGEQPRHPTSGAPRATSGFSRRDFEVVDARRVERADLVRDVLRRRRHAAISGDRDEPPAPDARPDADEPATASDAGHRGAADAAPTDKQIAGAEVSGSAAVGADSPGTDDTVQLKHDAEGRIAAAKNVATEDRDEARASVQTPGSDDTVQITRDELTRAPARPQRVAPIDSGEHGSQRNGVPFSADDPAPPTAALPIVQAPRTNPTATPSEVLPQTLGLLRTWRGDAEARAAAVAEAQLRARTERGRDRIDPTSDLRRAVESPGGREFLRDLLDDVVRPDDAVVAGNGLGDLSDRIPATISQRARRIFRLGTFAGPGMPWLTVPTLRRTARAFFGPELVRDTDEARAAATAGAMQVGAIPRAVPIGDPVVGDARASERLRRLAALVDDPAFPEVEFTLADVEPSLNLWNLEGTVEQLAAALAPIYFSALGGPTTRGRQTLIMLRATSSADLEPAVSLFMRILDEPALRDLRAGISLPAEFPESIGMLRRLTGWAHMRHEDLGAPVTIGITRAGDIQRERVDAVMNGWRLASFAEDRDVDASVVRLLDQGLNAEHSSVVHLELDADVLRDAALGMTLSAVRRGSPLRVVVPIGAGAASVERLRGGGAQVVQRMPLVVGDSMRPAVPYLLRRVDQEAAAAEALELSESMLTGRDTMHPDDERLLEAVGRMFQLPGGPNRSQERVDAEDAATVTASIGLDLFPEGLLDEELAAIDADAERETGARALEAGARIPHIDPGEGEFLPPGAHERQKPAAPSATEQFGPLSGADPSDTGPSARLTEIVLGLRRGRYLRNTFRHSPVTDPSLAVNREWATRIQRRIGRSRIGEEEALAARVTAPEQVEELLSRAKRAAPEWGAKPGWERAAHLERAAKAIEANRARLVEVAVSEFGVPLADADGDVSRTVDVANHAAHLARQLDRMQGAAFHPVEVTVVLPPSSPPIVGAASGALTALAAGSAVIVKASPKTRRTAAVLASVLWAIELPTDLVQLANMDETLVVEEQLARSLITDDRVGRVLLTGTLESARTMLSWRPDLPLIAATSAKNSMIVTPAADLDQAAADVARSAFLSTGQRAGHIGNVILVGSVARSARFLEQLADAVTSMPFGYPSDPGALAGPLVHAADAQMRFALTQLGAGERWLVEPRQLDDTGRLWSPGVRLGVQPGSYTHLTEFFGPVLGVMHARTLGDAITMQNATQFGLSAGLQSRDRSEIGRWIHEVQAGNLYVNRDTLGNVVQRQPFGGWRRSAVGTQQMSGGPNAVMPLGGWRIDPGQASPTLHLRGMDPKTVRLIEAAQPSLDYAAFDRVRRTALSCQIAWNEEFGMVSDVENLAFERNLFRYLPAAVTVRLAEGAPLEELIRMLAGARIVRAVPDISTAMAIPDAVAAVLEDLQFSVRVESDDEFAARVQRKELESLRIRLLGGSRRQVAEAVGGDPDIAIWSGPVSFAGRVELLPFLREQSISITSHRHGRPDPRVAELFAYEKLLDPDKPFGDFGDDGSPVA